MGKIGGSVAKIVGTGIVGGVAAVGAGVAAIGTAAFASAMAFD